MGNGSRRLHRAHGLCDEAGDTGERGEDGGRGVIQRLHRAPGRLAGGLVVMHQTRQPIAVPARAFDAVHAGSSAAQRRRYERHRCELAQQPERSQRSQHAAKPEHRIKR